MFLPRPFLPPTVVQGQDKNRNEVLAGTKERKAWKQQKYLAIKEGTNCICPTCEQHIQNESKEKTIANMKKDLTNAFNRKNTF